MDAGAADAPVRPLPTTRRMSALAAGETDAVVEDVPPLVSAPLVRADAEIAT